MMMMMSVPTTIIAVMMAWGVPLTLLLVLVLVLVLVLFVIK